MDKKKKTDDKRWNVHIGMGEQAPIMSIRQIIIYILIFASIFGAIAGIIKLIDY